MMHREWCLKFATENDRLGVTDDAHKDLREMHRRPPTVWGLETGMQDQPAWAMSLGNSSEHAYVVMLCASGNTWLEVRMQDVDLVDQEMRQAGNGREPLNPMALGRAMHALPVSNKVTSQAVANRFDSVAFTYAIRSILHGSYPQSLMIEIAPGVQLRVSPSLGAQDLPSNKDEFVPMKMFSTVIRWDNVGQTYSLTEDRVISLGVDEVYGAGDILLAIVKALAKRVPLTGHEKCEQCKANMSVSLDHELEAISINNVLIPIFGLGMRHCLTCAKQAMQDYASRNEYLAGGAVPNF